MAENPRLLSLGMNGILSERSGGLSGMSGMAEGHDRYARGLKPWALAQGVGSFFIAAKGNRRHTDGRKTYN